MLLKPSHAVPHAAAPRRAAAMRRAAADGDASDGDDCDLDADWGAWASPIPAAATASHWATLTVFAAAWFTTSAATATSYIVMMASSPTATTTSTGGTRTVSVSLIDIAARAMVNGGHFRRKFAINLIAKVGKSNFICHHHGITS